MPTLNIEVLIANHDADAVFDRISRFEDYSRYTDAVREITVAPATNGYVDSSWSVNFRNGILCWAERDWIDASTRTIEFDQTEGDFDEFKGRWKVEALGSDVAIYFAIDFDLGMPSLAPIIDPIAMRTLEENMIAILRGLFGDLTVIPVETAEVADVAKAHV